MKHEPHVFFIISSITTVRKLFCVISGAYSDGYLLVSFVTLEFDHVTHVAYLPDCPTVISCNWGRFFLFGHSPALARCC